MNIKVMASKFKWTTVFSLLVVSLVGCDDMANHEAEEKTSVVKTTEATTENINPNWETYIVATDPSNAPYEVKDEHGVIEGFDVDLIRAIGQIEHFNVDVIPQAWAGIFESLDTGEKDILIAPLTITPERDELVDFTIPYIYPTRTAYLLPQTAKKKGIESYQDLKKATVAAKKATTNVSSLEKDFGAGIQIIPVDSQYLALTAVTSGRSEVGFGDTAVMQFHANQIPETEFFTIEQPLDEPVKAAFAVKNGNKALKDKLDNGLKKAIQNGTYRQLAIKWFGEELGTKIANRTEQYTQ